ncbi:hypothetical protein ACKI1I_28365 [Streptomyces turgidiscabies]|uniref:Uncharacterized protein n=1 Tax=Streptomyces turgidiscabies (strain Car8) TaxID=698760 RepID=L7FCS6_STRT8|nr:MULTISPECIES: hypothetical protein [Streptomyces]ELP69057.1 hypothetical protein STRTUCAR8_00316 [Streptomyces turgidiscabies Car8]MDX3498238.1 hypothetical protein [Streptomyces turgidiscabies]GAQ75211.1 hypothetical protein T45_06992 [Streptomyces turgidiscabies]
MAGQRDPLVGMAEAAWAPRFIQNGVDYSTSTSTSISWPRRRCDRSKRCDARSLVIRCFDGVAWTYGESGYRDKWGRPFPRTELEALRCLWRADEAQGTDGMAGTEAAST